MSRDITASPRHIVKLKRVTKQHVSMKHKKTKCVSEYMSECVSVCKCKKNVLKAPNCWKHVSFILQICKEDSPFLFDITYSTSGISVNLHKNRSYIILPRCKDDACDLKTRCGSNGKEGALTFF